MSEIPESKKPINFKIKLGIGPDGGVYNSKFSTKEFKIEDHWLVNIEAYEQLQKQNQELIKALKFYADGDNWGYIAPDKVDYRVIEKSDFGIGEFQLTELTDDEWVGGRRAREVLEKYQNGDL